MKLKGFNEFVNESYSGDGINIFDIDDTLICSSALIRVFDPKTKEEFSLTPAQFNSYEKLPHHQLDFSDFDNKDILLNGRVIEWVFNILVKTMKMNKAVGIITARGDKNIILELLKKHGLRINPAFVFAVGGETNPKYTGSIAERKKQAFEELIEMGFRRFQFFDDNLDNLEYAKQLEKIHDGVTVKIKHILDKWIPRFESTNESSARVLNGEVRYWATMANISDFFVKAKDSKELKHKLEDAEKISKKNPKTWPMQVVSYFYQWHLDNIKNHNREKMHLAKIEESKKVFAING